MKGIRVQFYNMDGGLYRKSYIQHISKEEYKKISNNPIGAKIIEIQQDDWYGKKLPETLR